MVILKVYGGACSNCGVAVSKSHKNFGN